MKNKISKKALMAMLALSVGTSVQAAPESNFALQEVDTDGPSEVEIVCASGSGGHSLCRLKGGEKKLPRRFRTNQDGIIFFGPIERLHISHQQSKAIRNVQIDLQANLNGVNYEILKPGQSINSDSNLVKLWINNNSQEFGIVALNTDADGSKLEPEVMVKTKRVKEREGGVFTSGVTKITFPRTVILPIGEFDEFIQTYQENGTELSFEDAQENGSIKITCRFKNIPTSEIEE